MPNVQNALVCDEQIATRIQQKILTKDYESVAQFREDLNKLNQFIYMMLADLQDLNNRFILAKNQIRGTHYTYIMRTVRLDAAEKMTAVFEEAIAAAKEKIKTTSSLRDELLYIFDMEELQCHKLF